MVAETSRGGKKSFAEIRITVTGGRRRTHFVLGPTLQTVALSGLLCGALGLGTLGVGRISEPRRVAHQEKAAQRTEIANTDLQDAVARLQDRLARTASQRVAAQTRLSALAGKAGTLRGQLAATQAKLQASRAPPAPPPAAAAPPAANPQNLAQLQQAIDRVQRDVHALKAENATLAARLNKAEADRAGQGALTRRYQVSLVAAQRAAKRLGGR